MTPEQYSQSRAIAAELVAIKAKLAVLGLFHSLKALDAATDALGWEMAQHMAHQTARGEQP